MVFNLFICVCRKSKSDEKDQQVKEYFPRKSLSIYHRTTQSNCVTASEINSARNERMNEVQIFVYLDSLSLLFLLTYSSQITDSFRQVQHLRKYFDFDEISTVDDYWRFKVIYINHNGLIAKPEW